MPAWTLQTIHFCHFAHHMHPNSKSVPASWLCSSFSLADLTCRLWHDGVLASLPMTPLFIIRFYSTGPAGLPLHWIQLLCSHCGIYFHASVLLFSVTRLCAPWWILLVAAWLLLCIWMFTSFAFKLQTLTRWRPSKPPLLKSCSLLSLTY